MSTATLCILNPRNPAPIFPALDAAEAEIVRLNATLDIACRKLAEKTEEELRLNRLLDAACDELRKRGEWPTTKRGSPSQREA